MGKRIINRKQKRNNQLNKHDYYCIVQYKFYLEMGFSCGLIAADKN